MYNAWISITIISSLISGILAAIISIFYYRRAEKIKAKIETLKNFCGYRYDLRGDNFTKTLNEIFIVFQDSKDVLEKLNQFHEVIISHQAELANGRLVLLFKAMCNDLKINPNKYSESFFLKAFNVKV